MTCLITWEWVFCKLCIKKFPVFSTVRELTNSQFTTAQYWTVVEAKWNPSIWGLRVYSDLCLVLIVSPSVARSLKLSPAFTNCDEINSRTIICAARATWQAHDIVSDVIRFTTYSFGYLMHQQLNIKQFCILPAKWIYKILKDLRIKSKYFAA